MTADGARAENADTHGGGVLFSKVRSSSVLSIIDPRNRANTRGVPVFRKDHAQTISWSAMTIHPAVVALWKRITPCKRRRSPVARSAPSFAERTLLDVPLRP